MMRKSIEEVDGISDEVIATYNYPVNNFHPDSVRRSLRRATKRADEGPDGCLEIEVAMKKLRPPLSWPEIKKLGDAFKAVTLGTVVKGCLEIIDPDQPENITEDSEELKIILLPLAAVKAMQVSYRIWEPKRP